MGGGVAHKILETAQSPNSPFLFDFGLGLGSQVLDSVLSILSILINLKEEA